MEEIRKLFKRMFITVIIFLIYGLVTANKHILLGTVSGGLVAILSLYILSVNVKSIAYSQDVRYAKKIAILGYTKRYILYILYLVSILYFLDFKYFVAGIIGLLSVKANIYILVISEKLKNLKK